MYLAVFALRNVSQDFIIRIWETAAKGQRIEADISVLAKDRVYHRVKCSEYFGLMITVYEDWKTASKLIAGR